MPLALVLSVVVLHDGAMKSMTHIVEPGRSRDSVERQRGLPDPPSIVHWPPAVRSAELIRGTLVRCGPGLRPVAWPDTPRVRLAALAPWLGRDRVPTHLTAAWIWGAAAHPGSPMQLAVRGGTRRPEFTPRDVHVRSLSFGADELTLFGSYAVTSPVRTVCDLLRTRQNPDLATQVACRLLLRLIPGGHSVVLAAIASRQHFRAVARNHLLEFVTA